MKKPIFIAHRGAPTPARRQNTVAAFERASASQRFSYIELDVRRTRTDDDGNRVPIVTHDYLSDELYTAQRIAKSKRSYPGIKISSLTYQMLRDDSLEITTLADALRSLNGHPVDLDIKDIAAAEETIEMIKEFVEQSSSRWKYEHFIVSSFDWRVLQTVKDKLPDVGIGLLYGFKNLPKSPFKTITKLKPRFIVFNKWLTPVMAPLAKWHRISNRYVYTVNNYYEARFLQLLGVNGFTTDQITLPERFTN